MNIRKTIHLGLSLVGLALPLMASADTFHVLDSDFVDGVYEFRYRASTGKATVNDTEISFTDILLTNDGWVKDAFFWRAMGSFLDAQDSGSGTMGWDLSTVTRKITKVELLADAHLSQFEQWRTHAWCDRLYGRIALPDTEFGTVPYVSVFEFVGDNDPDRRTVETPGFVDDITDVIRQMDADWLNDPTLFELKLGYQEHPEDTEHPPIPYNHLQIFRDNTGEGDDSFLLRITLQPSKLVNLSTRVMTGSDAESLIAGFVITGDTPKTMLIRGIGPTLADYGVTGVLEDPMLEVYSGSIVVDDNDDWGGGSEVAEAMTTVGAFGLSNDSADACLLLTLEPGAYTAIVSAKGDPGIALVEVYEMP